jgi:hypothetical protein
MCCELLKNKDRDVHDQNCHAAAGFAQQLESVPATLRCQMEDLWAAPEFPPSPFLSAARATFSGRSCKPPDQPDPLRHCLFDHGRGRRGSRSWLCGPPH